MSEASLKRARESADKWLGDWIGEYDPDESRWIMCKGALAAVLDAWAQEAVRGQVTMGELDALYREAAQRERERCAKICEFHGQQAMANAIRECK